MKNEKSFCAVSIVTALIMLAPSACSAQARGGCGALAGEWNWSTSGLVTTNFEVLLKDDHTVLYNGQPSGRWECKDDARGLATIHWVNGFIDSITLAGDRISGTSSMQGVYISATRKGSARANPTPTPPPEPNPKPPPSTQPNPGRKPDSVPMPSADTARPDARLAAGWCVIDHDNYRQAIAFLDSVVSRNPRDAQALYYRGRCWHYANQTAAGPSMRRIFLRKTWRRSKPRRWRSS